MKTNLYSTYFISDSHTRQLEIDHCLIQNLTNDSINRVNIFVHSNDQERLNLITDSVDFHHKNKLNIILLNRIPSYKDWLDYSKQNTEISIFANADIYFDSSIKYSYDLLKKYEYNNLICLSRHEVLANDIIEPHPNPQWSQDAWIINSDSIKNIDFLNLLNIQTGLCRCDNQFAYYFAINGWNLYNIFQDIKCFHKHTSKIRTYNKKDTDIIGHTAFVFPTTQDHPSKIDICIFPKSNSNIEKAYVSKFLY